MPHGMLDTALGAIVQIAVFIWIFGLFVSIVVKDHKKYLQLSQKYIGGFIKKHWRYILVFILGYLSGYPGTIQLLIH